jgi:SAM-dependent methyltransferase
MTTSSAKCAVCCAALDVHVLSFPRLPTYLVPLPSELASRVERADLHLYACSSCGHVQVPNPDPGIQRLIYEEYYSYYSVDSSEALVPHYRRPFEDFLFELNVRNLLRGTVLEIGCSSGKAIPLLRRFFKHYCGIDPSERIREAEKQFPECEFVRGFFPEALADRSFDVVISQFNLEHMPDPARFLDGVRRVSVPGTLLIIQVPDAADSVRRGFPCFVAHEHIHYFRAATLEKLLRSHGFTPLHWGSAGAGLSCAAAVSESQNFSPVTHNESTPLSVALRQKQLARNPPVLSGTHFLFYGVGPILHWCLLQLPGQCRTTVVDDNPAYHGMGVPGYNIIVQPLTPELLQAVNCVYLTLNSIYYSTVINRLTAAGFTGEVLGFIDGIWQVPDTCLLQE